MPDGLTCLPVSCLDHAFALQQFDLPRIQPQHVTQNAACRFTQLRRRPAHWKALAIEAVRRRHHIRVSDRRMRLACNQSTALDARRG
ncbi:hypothetical protein D9M69_619540 [compost metagenome]